MARKKSAAAGKKTASKATSKAGRRRRSKVPQPPTPSDQSSRRAIDWQNFGGLESEFIIDDSHDATGRLLVVSLNDDKSAMDAAVSKLCSMTGIAAGAVCSTEDFPCETGVTPAALQDASIVRFEALGVAVVSGTPDEVAAACSSSGQAHGMSMEHERWNRPLGHRSTCDAGNGGASTDHGANAGGLAAHAGRSNDPDANAGGLSDGDAPVYREASAAPVSRDHLLGARAAIDAMLDLGAERVPRRRASVRSGSTWGLDATAVAASDLSGRGVRVAVLDTGFDNRHPDFTGRDPTLESFVPAGEFDHGADDSDGHGTHCMGIACGSRLPGAGARYGIASNAQMFSGKVLRRGPHGETEGADAWILAGIDWALRNQCQVISMSLGATTSSAAYPRSYERAARNALRGGSLMVVAAGNGSDRANKVVAPICWPANCPSILAVAAVDESMQAANFSNGQVFGNGGEVNLAAPGVDILSSAPMPQRTAVYSGTSMAAPHVAGIAALICEQTGLNGLPLYRELRRRARSLGAPATYGNGLSRV